MTMISPEDSKKDDMSGKESSSKPRVRWMVWLLAVCIRVAVAYLFLNRPGSTQSKPASKLAAPGMPVIAVAAKTADVGIYLTGLGSVTPLNTVTVKTRVDGQLMRALFKEGQIVNSGDLIAEIDPRPFEVQLTQAEGQMARDQALLKNAILDLKRYQVLSEQDSVSQQQRDTQEALVRQYEGAVKSDQGQIDNAKLQLLYCRITAPISGRMGLRLIDPGNIVHASDTNGLVVITQLQPITVIFPIPEDNLPKVLSKLKGGTHLAVEAFDREQKQKLADGYLLTVDNQVDPTTGTVKFKADFANKGNELFPNQFVNARLLVEMKHNAIVVPASAVQRGPKGTFVYVVKADKTVTVRPVTAGVPQNGDMSIESGLAADELVVADGAERLREGSKVILRDESARSGPSGRKNQSPQSGQY